MFSYQFQSVANQRDLAAADSQITQAGSKQIRARWEELKTVTEGFVTCCEEGNFGPLKNEAAKRAAANQQ